MDDWDCPVTSVAVKAAWLSGGGAPSMDGGVTTVLLAASAGATLVVAAAYVPWPARSPAKSMEWSEWHSIARVSCFHDLNAFPFLFMLSMH